MIQPMRRLPIRLLFPFVFSLMFVLESFGHNQLELTTQVFLRADRLEIQVTVSQQAMELLTGDQPNGLAEINTPSGFNSELPRLKEAAGSLFRLTDGDGPLTMLETNVTKGVEDHVEFRLVYSSPVHGPLRIEAPEMSKLPAADGYGAAMVVMDMVNKKVLQQRLLTSANSKSEVALQKPAIETVAAALPEPAKSTSAATSPIEVAAEGLPKSSPEQTGRPGWAVVVVLAVALVGWLALRFVSGDKR